MPVHLLHSYCNELHFTHKTDKDIAKLVLVTHTQVAFIVPVIGPPSAPLTALPVPLFQITSQASFVLVSLTASSVTFMQVKSHLIIDCTAKFSIGGCTHVSKEPHPP